MKIIITTIVLLAGFVALVRYLEMTSVFYPSKQILATPLQVGCEYEDIYFKTEDNVELNGWMVKSPKAISTILYFHGNAGNIGDRLATIRYFHDLDFNVFIVDYRGYGSSKGSPTEAGIYLDSLAAYDYLMTRNDIDHKKIIVFGESLGGVPAIYVSTKREVAGLIIDSSFSSAKDMAKLIYPFVPSFMLMIKLDSIGMIKDVTVPKLFIHSKDDLTVPIKLGQKLFDASPGPKHWVTVSGGHNDIRDVLDQQKVTKAIKDFFTPSGLIK